MNEPIPSPSFRGDSARPERQGRFGLRGVDKNTPRNVWIARALFANEWKIWPFDIESETKPFGLVVKDESCAICGGFFPRVGQLRGFYAADSSFNLTHIGCLIEVGNWVEL